MLPGWAALVVPNAADLDRAATYRVSVHLLWKVEVMTRDLDLLMISEVRSNVIGVIGEWFEYFGENPQYRVILMDYSDDWVEVGISVIGELETRRFRVNVSVEEVIGD